MDDTAKQDTQFYMFGADIDEKDTIKTKKRNKLRRAEVSLVYDIYWNYAFERQNIYFRKLLGNNNASPTDDPILRAHRFTNVYRASDRVSQFLIKHVIYRDDLPSDPNETFFRIMLFKLFNKIETWLGLEADLGPLTAREFSYERYEAVLDRLKATRSPIYSAAYIMPSGKSSFGSAIKHRNHLRLIEHMLETQTAKKIADAPSMKHGFEILRALPLFGDFLAYQLIIDINYSELVDFDESEFVVAGPGAQDGLSKCFTDMADYSYSDLIKIVRDHQVEEFDRLGLNFRTLWGRPLQMIDCQNIFCEISKYSRASHPSIKGLSGRTRIKQKYRAHGPMEKPFFPPKWGINDAVAQSL